MTLQKNHILALLLLFSGLILASLVPGGPIENRDFSAINPAILLSFNVYLTVLGLGSWVLVVYLYKRGRYAAGLALLAGVSYLLVYGVDLAGYFPQSPSAMPRLLWWAEVIGVLLSVPTTVLAWQLLMQAPAKNAVAWQASKTLWITLGLLAVLIVLFATWSAMSPLN